MNLVFRSARLLGGSLHQTVADVWVKNGRIEQIGPSLQVEAGREVRSPNLCLSAGWCDLRTHLPDPGHESREELSTLHRAAAAGGFADVLVLPNSQPVRQTKASIGFARQPLAGSPVRLLAAAALTLDAAGKDFTDMLDLHQAGAVAFTDGEQPSWDADLLLKSLQYLAQVDALVIQRPEEPTLARHGQMHEGLVSNQLGLRGIPAMAEELMLQRDLRLLAYAAATFSLRPRLHFSLLSTEAGVGLVRKAQKEGLNVTADTAAHYLAFTDEDLSGFDALLKVSPPFRTRADVNALRQGLADGTLQAVVSDHCPLDEEAKNLEFDLAEPGISSLETTFATANTYGNLPLETLIERLTTGPRAVLNLASVSIETGQTALLTAFDPDAIVIPDPKSWQSKGRNNPFFGKNLKGKVLGVIRGHEAWLADA